MTKIIANQISTKKFTYLKEDRTFIAEISSLNTDPLSRIYPDACDEGFTLVNPKTGVGITFTLEETQRNRDMDIVAWKFVPVFEVARRRPDLADLRVTIIND